MALYVSSSEETGAKWLAVLPTNKSWLPGSLSTASFGYKAHAGSLTPLCSSHSAHHPRFLQLKDFSPSSISFLYDPSMLATHSLGFQLSLGSPSPFGPFPLCSLLSSSVTVPRSSPLSSHSLVQSAALNSPRCL